MHDLYSFVRGPLAWIAFTVFFGGSIYRLISMGMLARKKDPMVIHYWSAYYSLRSIFHWLVPFAGVNMRKHPLMTCVSFLFHFCLILGPIFLCAHVLLIKESWNISWWFMPGSIADAMTMIVIAACLFFLIRRIVCPEVRYLTTASDFFLLAAVAAPFVSGLWVFHQWPGHILAVIIHILSGELLLIIIPFSRLSHMLFFPFTRGYMGSEFGAVRHVKDW